MKEIYKRSHLAKKIGISKPGIKKAIDSGNLVVNEKGDIDVSDTRNIPYIIKKVPNFYQEQKPHPNAVPGKQNGFPTGSGQNTGKRLTSPKNMSNSETIITDTVTEMCYDSTDISQVKIVEQIKKIKFEQERIKLNNQKAKGDLIETKQVLHILGTYIPEMKKTLIATLEQHIRNICSEQSVDVSDTSEYLQSFNDIVETALNQANENTRKSIDEILGEQFEAGKVLEEEIEDDE